MMVIEHEWIRQGSITKHTIRIDGGRVDTFYTGGEFGAFNALCLRGVPPDAEIRDIEGKQP